jgi:hypothetical protein
MAGTHLLSAISVEQQNKPRYYADGNGLYLRVRASGTKSWAFCYTRNRTARDMGLGSVLDVSLTQARAKAADCQRLLASGRDPITETQAGRAVLAFEVARAITFRECVNATLPAPGFS